MGDQLRGRPVVLRRRQVRISASAGGVTLAELHEVLQVRTRILDDDLADDFARWHPGFTRHNGPVELVAWASAPERPNS